MKTVTVPSKIMILGEYGVLVGQPAILATFSPRFAMGPEETLPYRPDPRSPSGKLLRDAGIDLERGDWSRWSDPFSGRGGFGGSTAEYLAASLLLAGEHWKGSSAELKSVWRGYRAHSAPSTVTFARPSGADLIAQACGGTTEFWIDPEGKPQFRAVKLPVRLEIFSAAQKPERKVRTHDHLGSLGKWDPTFSERCGAIVGRALGAGSARAIGLELNQYEAALAAEGLVHPEALKDARALRGMRGVLGVKGCGALLSDAVIVAVDSVQTLDELSNLRTLARERGLDWVAVLDLAGENGEAGACFGK